MRVVSLYSGFPDPGQMYQALPHMAKAEKSKSKDSGVSGKADAKGSPKGKKSNAADPQAVSGPVWQFPLLVVAMLMLVSGLVMMMRSAPGMDFDTPLDRAEHSLKTGDFKSWQEQLDKIAPLLSEGATDDQKARFHIIRADGLYHRQKQLGESVGRFNKLIVDDYRAAVNYGAVLGGARYANYAETLLALGHDDEAIELADGLPEEQAKRRHEIYTKLIRKKLRGPDPDYDAAVELLTRMQKDPTLSPELRAWVYAHRAQAVLDQGNPELAATMLLRFIQRVEGEGEQNTGELLALLGRAYYEIGDQQEAVKQLRRAQERLDPESPISAQVLVYLGQIQQSTHDYQQARDTFQTVIAKYSNTLSYEAALLGRAEVYSALGQWDRALADYQELAARFALTRSVGESSITRGDVIESLVDQHDRQAEQGNYQRALEYIELALGLSDPDSPNPALLEKAAKSHFQLATSMLAEATNNSNDPAAILSLEPSLRRQIRAHFHEAGQYYIKHARLITLQDNDAYGESIWLAGDAFDRAGDSEQAIEAFKEYLQSRDKDVRGPATRYRLGRLFQARGDYETARTYFDGLINGHDRTSQEARASYVPLAQCLLQIDAKKYYDESLRLLLYVLQGGELDPDAREFHDALIQLALTYFRAGNYTDAIRRFEEAITRYPDDPRINELRFRLAQSYRLNAEEISNTLREGMRESDRKRLTQLRTDDLTRAEKLYGTVRDELAKKNPKRLTKLQAGMLRQSYFYKADCLYSLGKYEDAIREYNIAISHYGEDPASLYATVQKVNAYIALGRYKDARTAQQAAKLRLDSMPDSAFEDSTYTLMTRKQWENWLDSVMLLDEKEKVSAVDNNQP